MNQETGTIKLINATEQVTDSFKKRSFVLTTSDSQYPQDIMFELTQDRVDLGNEFKVGDQKTVFFNLRGREYNKKDGSGVGYFLSAQAWKVADVEGAAVAQGESFAPSQSQDLPF